MKIAIIGATGRQGSLLLREALQRGHQVTAIVRDKTKLDPEKVQVIEKGILDLSYQDLKDFDVVINAFGTRSKNTPVLHQTTLKHLADNLSGHDAPRLLVVGGAGSLYVDPELKVRVMDTPDFPDAYKPTATNMGAAFDALKVRNDVNWTYLSPSANFVADGIRTGKYRIGKDELLVNQAGQSEISYADYAIAMIDEAENAKHVKSRFTVVSE